MGKTKKFHTLKIILSLILSVTAITCINSLLSYCWSSSDPGQPVPDTATPAEILAGQLQDIDLDSFFEVSFRELVLRNPETVLERGLTDIYGVTEVRLTDISDEYTRETQRMEVIILEKLRQYDREAMTPEQQISCDVYEWYLDDRVRSHEFMYHDYPVTYYFITAVHHQMIYFFTDLHPLAGRQDAEDYITRLGLVDTKFEQLLEGLQLREEAGIIPPRFSIQWAIYGLQNLVQADATQTPFYQIFAQKIDELDDINDTEKQELLRSAKTAIEESVLPAYSSLLVYMQHLESIAPIEVGVWNLPDGEAYYNYLLHHYTSTDMTADEIHELGKQDLERIHDEMRILFDQLGYPRDESLAELFNRAAEDGGNVSGDHVVYTYETIIEDANRNLNDVFDIRPQADVIVIGGPIGDFYMPGAYDGSRPGAFYANVSSQEEALYSMPSLAYHEAIPGHHWQITIAQEADLPSFRNGLIFTAYAEGWALYAERLAWELGWYEDDVFGNLGRLQFEAYRAARLVIDTGIHAKRWTFNQAVEFMTANVGYEYGNFINPDYEVARYVVWPGQAVSYKVGMNQILELRQKAINNLGDQFDIREFHSVVLVNGSMPLEVLKQVIDEYIREKRGL
ncbi:MAG: DUF885 domain-containing protein [Candidatus Aegiribacteria sp.]|nr:DUF885 domain-containing protein [Candidatus Aegiribacteria sp.]